MKIIDTFKKIFFPIEEPSHEFSLPSNDDNSLELLNNSNRFQNSTKNTHSTSILYSNTTMPSVVSGYGSEISDEFSNVKEIFPSIDVNIDYIKVKYNLLINSDIILREFTLTARNKQYKAFLLYYIVLIDLQYLLYH